jgi:hypothetical protein
MLPDDSGFARLVLKRQLRDIEKGGRADEIEKG